METVIEKVAKTIKKFDRFLITSHMNPEGDSLGSQLAIANLLKYMGKDFAIFNNDIVPERYQFLPQVDLVKHKVDIDEQNFDAAVVLDCPDLARCGKVRDTIKKAKYVVNIDHHMSNKRFGDLNWIEKDASSVGEMVYKLYKKLNTTITKETALYLYIAILTDTGSFNYSNTSSATHEIVSELLGYGIEPYNVSKSIYENKSLSELKLLGRVLSGLKVVKNGKIAYAVIRKKFFDETKTKPSACENFVDFARSIKGVDVAMVFREDIEKNNVFHVSLRSSLNVDVSSIASCFGGGGHKRASGCVLQGNFATVKEKIMRKVKDEL